MPDLLEIADAIEKAGDLWREAIDQLADAEVDLLHAENRAMTAVSFEPATARKDLAKVRCTGELAAVVRAKAQEKRAKSKVDELERRLMAVQSHLKYQGRNDGGDWT